MSKITLDGKTAEDFKDAHPQERKRFKEYSRQRVALLLTKPVEALTPEEKEEVESMSLEDVGKAFGMAKFEGMSGVDIWKARSIFGAYLTKKIPVNDTLMAMMFYVISSSQDGVEAAKKLVRRNGASPEYKLEALKALIESNKVMSDILSEAQKLSIACGGAGEKTKPQNKPPDVLQQTTIAVQVNTGEPKPA